MPGPGLYEGFKSGLRSAPLKRSASARGGTVCVSLTAPVRFPGGLIRTQPLAAGRDQLTAPERVNGTDDEGPDHMIFSAGRDVKTVLGSRKRTNPEQCSEGGSVD